MKRRDLPIVLAASQILQAQERPMLKLESPKATVAFDLLGGGLVDFQLRGNSPTNPFTWEEAGGAMQPRPRGHFLCMDRWGAPSKAEAANHMPFHGEASRVPWKQTGEGIMAADLPIAGLHIEREAMLNGATLTIRDRVTNRNPLGRIFNMVQHGTIAPPFLDEQTFIDSNAALGFAQSTPDEQPRRWPRGHDSDLRSLLADPNPNVVSFVIDGGTGWVAAGSPSANLAIAYLWKTTDYPWLSIWRDVKAGKPAARGLEFGTTGLHQPYAELVKRGRMLDRPLYSYLDASETAERSYSLMLRAMPPGTTRVTDVRSSGAELDIKFA